MYACICFLCFIFFFSSLFILFYSGLFVLSCLLVFQGGKKKESMDLDGRRDKEEIGKVENGESIDYRKQLFSVKVPS